LYKDDTYLEAVSFLSKFNNLQVVKTKEELEKYIQKTKEEFQKIDEELKEIMPSVFNLPIILSNIKEENMNQIINKIIKLEKVSENYKRGFIYKYQEPKCKKIINDISMLLINSNSDCKKQFNMYVNSCVNIDKIMQKVNNYKDYEKVKNTARTEMLKKVGNQVLKMIKETKTEEYQRKVREYWNQKNKEYEEKSGEFEARQEIYYQQLERINIQNLIKETYKLLAQENLSKTQKLKRVTKTFGDLSKREIKEIIRKSKGVGFDWYSEM